MDSIIQEILVFKKTKSK